MNNTTRTIRESIRRVYYANATFSFRLEQRTTECTEFTGIRGRQTAKTKMDSMGNMPGGSCVKPSARVGVGRSSRRLLCSW